MSSTVRSRARPVRGFPGAVVLGLALLAVAACGVGGGDPAPAHVAPGPTLEPLWSRATNVWGPGEQTSGRWWAVSLDSAPSRPMPSGPNPGTHSRGVVVGHALTGRVRTVPAPHEAATCEITALPPREDGAGLFRVGTLGSNGCGEFRVLDTTTGRYDATAQQAGVAREADWTWDGVTVVPTEPRAEVRFDGSFTGRAKDGTVLWTGPALETRPTKTSFVFDWTERVIPTDEGPLLVTYDFARFPVSVPDVGDQPNATLTLLDPKTGKPVREIGRVPGSNLRWVVGDIAIFAKAEGYTSSYEGYQLTGLTARTAWTDTEASDEAPNGS